MKDASHFFNFASALRGYDLFHKRTGKQIFKYEAFDPAEYQEEIKQLMENTHPCLEAKKRRPNYYAPSDN